MKERWEQERAELRAEQAALHQRLHALEAQLAGAHVGAKALSRWRLSKIKMMILLSAVVLSAAGGVLYGEAAIEALLIDKDGKVGIGTTPNATLDVAGTLNVTQKASLADTEIAGTLDVKKTTNLADTTIKGTLTTEGNVGIGTTSPGAKLDVGGKADTDKQISLQLRSGNTTLGTPKGNQVTFGYNNEGIYRHAIQTRHHSAQQKGNAIDFYVWKYVNYDTVSDKAAKDKAVADNAAAIGGLHTMTIDGGNVGIGTLNPEAKLQVFGEIKLGPSGEYYTPAAQEGSLVIVRGCVTAGGAKRCGAGFTVKRTSGGHYLITFEKAFTDVPVVTATPITNTAHAASLDKLTTGQVEVHLGIRNMLWADNDFHFIAIGPR